MNQDRERLLAAISDLTGRAEALFRRHTPEELLRKPALDAWSVAQCIEHLTTSLRLYLPAFEATLSAGGPRGNGPYRYGPVARLWIRLIEPGGPKMPAPPKMRPRGVGKDEGGKAAPVDPSVTLQEFNAAHARLVDLIRLSDGLDLARIRMASPVIPILRFPVGAWFETCIAHGRRHMAQAERVSAGLASPAGDRG